MSQFFPGVLFDAYKTDDRPGGEAAVRRFTLHAEVSSDRLETLTLSRLVEVATANAGDIERDKLTDVAARIYEMRRSRDRFLQAGLFGEPVWDMLLALYCYAARGEALSVSGLCYAAGVPQTTALRWSQLLEQKKLIDRTRDPHDGRRFFLSISAEGDAIMSAYLSSIYAKMTVVL